MAVFALKVLAWLPAMALLLLSLRRVVLMLAACLRPRAIALAHDLPSVALLIPARNEEGGLTGTLTALAALDYPSDRLFTVLIDDGSSDGTRVLCERWAMARERALAISFSVSRGKIAALNAGVAAAPPTELIAVCDADVTPRPDWLRRLAEAFADRRVGGAAALVQPLGADRTAVSRYAAVENWVNQLVTSAGKDRLDLNPMTNGASAYRRTALEGLGWFGVGSSGDDVCATVGLTRTGWRTRLVQSAIIEHAVVHTFTDYWKQHIRWSGNLADAGAVATFSNRAHIGMWRRVEAWVLSRGYVDRMVLLAVAGLVTIGMLPLWIPILYVATIAGNVTTALVKARTGRKFLGFFVSTLAFYAVDIAASCAAIAARRAPGPHTSPRAGG